MMIGRRISEIVQACSSSTSRPVDARDIRIVGTRATGGVGADPLISSLTQDSRQAREGSLFCCIPGEKFDGHVFASEAVTQGALALLVERELFDLPENVVQVVVNDTRAWVGHLADEFFGHPSRQISLIGITGTNGKTTTAHLLGSILRSAGLSTDILGTLSGTYTTPEASVLQQYFAELIEQGTQAVAMEVSSHALALGRVNGCKFAAGIFTNLGRDHLDFHGSEESYFQTKARLFTSEFTELGVINVDDRHGHRLMTMTDIATIPFSLGDISELSVSATSHEYQWKGIAIRVGMGGTVNVMNSLAAATTARGLGVATQDIVEGLASAPVIPGRFEKVDAGQDFVVLVDFAHTPDGLAEVLRSVRQSSPESGVILVFGCGGDRDKMKRPLMGETAVSLADVVIVTSDNPRSEDPEAIMSSIIAGVPDHMRHRLLATDVDRKRAIQRAIGVARSGDVVIIAGKGHELTQTIGSEVFNFSDREVALEILGGAR